MAYWGLHYHLVWTTYKREPLIDQERERTILGIIHQKAKELGLIIHAVGNTEDHLHVVVSIPPKISISDCLRHFKGASAHAVNNLLGDHAHFKWQEGYGALSIGERSLPSAISYVKDQKKHHNEQTLVAVYEHMAEEDDSPIIQMP